MLGRNSSSSRGKAGDSLGGEDGARENQLHLRSGRISKHTKSMNKLRLRLKKANASVALFRSPTVRMLLLVVVVMLGETETAIRIDRGVFMLLPTTGTETMTTTLAVVAIEIGPTEATDIVLAEAVASAVRAKVAVAVAVQAAVQAAVAVAAEAVTGVTDAHTDTIVVRENIDDTEGVRAVHHHAHVPLHVRAVGALRLIEIWTSLLLRRLDLIIMIELRIHAAE